MSTIAPTKDINMNTLPDSVRIGIDTATLYCYSAIDESNLSFDQKRSLIYSMYSFRCLFDSREMMYVNTILVKYKCTFTCPLDSHPKYKGNEVEFELIKKENRHSTGFGGLYVKDGDEYVVRFDCGSPVWDELVSTGKLTGVDATTIEKCDLYDMVYQIVNLNTATDELKSLMYLTFAYIMLIDAPHDNDLYDVLTESLHSEKIFALAHDSIYCMSVADSVSELVTLNAPQIVVDWYKPFLDYKQGLVDGVSRDTAKYKKYLAKGYFSIVLAGTEKLLDTYPENEELLLLNIASRVSFTDISSHQERENLLKETLALIESIIEHRPNKLALFTYYQGIALIGLGQRDRAEDIIKDCLVIDPSFEKAKELLRAMQSVKS